MLHTQNLFSKHNINLFSENYLNYLTKDEMEFAFKKGDLICTPEKSHKCFFIIKKDMYVIFIFL